MQEVKHIGYYQSPVGIVRIEVTGLGVRHLDFVEEIVDVETEHPILSEAKLQLGQYFNNKRTTFQLPLHAEGTHFQRNVWEELMKIPFGKTWSYEDLARRLGDVKVIRAAATANGRNPIPVIIPCHRVIGKYGSLTGYSAGKWRKQFLLELEQKDIQPKLL